MNHIDALLQPISGDDPCGRDMVFSAEFDQIAEARRQDDPHLDQGDWVTERKGADWPLVVRVTSTLLTEHTKDVRVAGWLVEAWGNTRGFGGLADGIALVDGLCSRYWEGLHPQADEDDLQQRVGNLSWVLSRCQQLLRDIPLTQADRGRYGAAFWDSAHQLANAIKRTPQEEGVLSQGRLTVAQFEAARQDTPPAFYASAQQELAACAQALDALDATLTERLGDEGPALSPLRSTLADVTDLVRRFAREAGVEATANVAVSDGGAAASAAPDAPARIEPVIANLPPVPTAAPVVAGPLQTREQALAQLREVAAFFRRTEPHSPVAYLADKAATWGDMPLHEWLRAVLKHDDALSGLEDMLGVKRGDGG